jgi:3-deoxy-D-manno-octulosonate 8-phosphate phosphatase KdsC-like HAD superfamily phosphatase
VLIADVGTSVLRGFGPERVDEIEREIDRLWPGKGAVRERLSGLRGRLEPQDVSALRRLSFWIEPVRRLRARASDPFAAAAPDDPSLGAEAAALAEAVAAAAARALADLSVDVLVSANVFLDVLPRGVDKGSTLRRVMDWLGAPDDGCVVAGDSLNDLGLFETGLRGIAVGNCEPALRERVAEMERVYQAGGEGVAGVLEGMLHHGFATGAQGKGERRGE